jgi:hypothetical protein
MGALALVGIGVLVWGWVVTANLGTGSGSTAGSECSKNALSGIGALWVAWLILLLLASIGFTVWMTGRRSADRRGERPDPLVSSLGIPGIAAAVVFFPGWLVLMTGLNCGL